ncbi:MAG: glycosyltransferase family 39 protein [Prolixibacteraceae bacterium]|nr:glycosyltransferase family 39 protein [Prolixibacteraceae bacterium]
MQKPETKKYTIYIIPLLFLLYTAPGALDYVFHFPDEKYYTDAVLQMMDKGDYFTPYKADGSPRFLKPISTYWVLMGSYKLFGVSTFSSRIFFWIAGALLVFITFLMTFSLSRNRKTATLAAFIVAANPLVIVSSSRSIPDILLVLFLTISAWGFLEILVRNNQQKRYYWMAYMGAAFAFETKGIPAAAFAGVSMLYLLLNPWKRKKINQLLKPLPIIISVLIALSWFFVMYIKHGSVYLESFFADQISERVSSKSAQTIQNLGLGIVTLIAFFIPWIIIVFSKPRELKKYIFTSDSQKKSIVGFIITWLILVILMSGAVFKFYDRYVLPVIPLVAILIASIITDSKTSFKKPIVSVLLIINLVLISVNILYSIFILSDWILISGILTSLIILTLWKWGLFKNISSEIVIANGVLLMYFNVFILLYPLLMPNPGKQLVNNLTEQGMSKIDDIYVYGNIRAASNIRIHCNDKWNVISMDTVFALPENSNHFLVFDEKEQSKLNLENYSIYKGSEEWLRVPESKFPDFLKTPVEKIKNSGTRYLIAKPLKN